MYSKQVFLWYPRKIWKVKDGKAVRGFAWLTTATEYITSPRVSPQPDVADNKARWPTYLDFIKDQKTVTPNAHYWYLIETGFIRRVVPGLITMDLTGVQPMTGPAGEIFRDATRLL